MPNYRILSRGLKGVGPVVIRASIGGLFLLLSACGSPAFSTAEPQPLPSASATLIPTETPTPRPPTPTPTASPTPPPPEIWSLDNPGYQVSGSVVVEIVRLVVASRAAIPELPWNALDAYPGWASSETVAELVFRITNNRSATISLFPGQAVISIGDQQIEAFNFSLSTAFGDRLDGDLPAGETRTGGYWFPIQDLTPYQISEITIRLNAPFNPGSLESHGLDMQWTISIPEFSFSPLD